MLSNLRIIYEYVRPHSYLDRLIIRNKTNLKYPPRRNFATSAPPAFFLLSCPRGPLARDNQYCCRQSIRADFPVYCQYLDCCCRIPLVIHASPHLHHRHGREKIAYKHHPAKAFSVLSRQSRIVSKAAASASFSDSQFCDPHCQATGSTFAVWECVLVIGMFPALLSSL